MAKVWGEDRKIWVTIKFSKIKKFYWKQTEGNAIGNTIAAIAERKMSSVSAANYFFNLMVDKVIKQVCGVLQFKITNHKRIGFMGNNVVELNVVEEYKYRIDSSDSGDFFDHFLFSGLWL